MKKPVEILAFSLIASILSAAATTQQRYIPDKIQEGVILHCFCWPLKDITAELPNIAASGFAAVQLSPMQAPNPAGQPWYYFYGPCDYRFYENAMGTRADLIELCSKASEYGIKIIEDIVPNHLVMDGAETGRVVNPWWFEVEDERVVADQGVVTWDSRWSETHQNVFGWEIRTDNADVQQRMREYLDDLYSMGVRGCRWDCAKHIGLPSEGDGFWAAVLVNPDMWHYGEILGAPNSHPELMREYVQYMSVTDDAFNGYVEHNSRHWQNIPRNKCVFWAESHDTFANGQWGSQLYTDAQIDRSYALVAARQGATALYLSRPGLLPKDDIKLATKGSTHFTSPAVREVNFFHNIMGDLSEAFWKGDAESEQAALVAVYRRKGAVVVNADADKSQTMRAINIPAGNLEDGEYADQITGECFTVADGRLRGSVGPTGIAVIYDPSKVSVPLPTIVVSPLTKSFSSDTATYTLSLSHASSGTYSIDGAPAVTFNHPVEITIGEGVEWGETITISWTAQNNVSIQSGTFEILKRDPADGHFVYVYDADNALEGHVVYTYIYSPSGDVNGQWPGHSMSYNPGIRINGRVGWYTYEIPIELELSGNAIVSTSGDGPRYPGGGSPGIALEGKSLAFIYSDGRWSVAEVKSVESADTPVQTYTYKVYFDNSRVKWSNVYAYCWDATNLGDNALSGKWPGTQLTDIAEYNGKPYYVYTLELDRPLDPATKVIFTNGSGPQTANLDFDDMMIYTELEATGELFVETTGVESLTANGEECVEYFDLQGRRHSEDTLSPGIYVMRQADGNCRKIAVR